MSNKTNVVEELTFEEYWERYSCASDTPKMAARAAWILAIKQEKRLQEIRLTQRALDGFAGLEMSGKCSVCGNEISVSVSTPSRQ